MVESEFTAQAFITTDLDDNQITAFHPGAMNFAHLNSVGDADGATIGIISPDGRDGMVAHAEQFHDAGIPFVFDPGQSLPMFGGEDLVQFIDQADWLTVNDYEWQLVQDRTGLDESAAVARLRALVVTKGGEGSVIHTPSGTIEIPAARAATTADPTGCGDAYRAGLLHGILNELDWETTGRIASLMGAIKIECHGTQNHRLQADELDTRFEEAFGRRIAAG